MQDELFTNRKNMGRLNAEEMKQFNGGGWLGDIGKSGRSWLIGAAVEFVASICKNVYLSGRDEAINYKRTH